MTVELLARSGGVLAAIGLAILLLARPREQRLAGLVLWAVGMALVVPLLAPSGQEGLAAAGVTALAVLGVGLAFLFRRWPWAFLLLALAAVPARVPVSFGDESATLLVPLYVIVAGAAVVLAWSLWRGEGAEGRELGIASWPVALFILWASLSAFWAGDATEAAVDLFFFVLPFGLLAVAVARLPWDAAGPRRLLRLLVAMAVFFSAVGIWQWTTKEIYWNEKVMRGNDNSVLFRVNSLFWDPSVYGRFLVLAVLATLVVLVVGRAWQHLALTIGALAVIWVGLLFSYSQSSFASLLAGLALLIVYVWRARGAQALAVLVIAAAVVASLAPPLEDVRSKLTSPSSDSVNQATRGRSDLITNGLRLAYEHPVLGVGTGNFASEYEQRFESRQQVPASHTTPITVLAETGLVGIVLLAWLLFAMLRLAFVAGAGGSTQARLLALTAGFGIVAIFVHALFYSAFFQDPTTWGLLGVAGLAARRIGAPEERLPARVRDSVPAVKTGSRAE